MLIIKKLNIENYKVIKKAEFEFKPITLFVGPNGSGKSTVIDLIEEISKANFENLKFKKNTKISNEFQIISTYEQFYASYRFFVLKFIQFYIRAMEKLNSIEEFKDPLHEYNELLDYKPFFDFEKKISKKKYKLFILDEILILKRKIRNVLKINGQIYDHFEKAFLDYVVSQLFIVKKLADFRLKPNDNRESENRSEYFSDTFYDINKGIHYGIPLKNEIKEKVIKRSKDYYSIFELTVPIVKKRKKNVNINLNGISIENQGFGISQVLRLIENLIFGGNFFLIQEPEVNLHPKFQSLLADFFVKSNSDYIDSHKIIETHSEYMIRKFQYLVAKGELMKENIVIYYFHHPDEIPEGQEQVKRIDILEDGSLSDKFGPGFFDESLNIQLEMAKLKAAKK